MKKRLKKSPVKLDHYSFAQSPLKLNQGLAHLENWSEQQIKTRITDLSNKMSQVWVYPDIDESVLESYRTIDEYKTSYSLEDHPFIAKGATKDLYQKFRMQVLALDENAREEFLKRYVAFKLDTNFVDVVPQASGLRLSLNCKFEDIHDPKGLCRDVTNLGRWGNGDVELKISQVSELPYAVELIQQVIDMQIEGWNR